MIKTIAFILIFFSTQLSRAIAGDTIPFRGITLVDIPKNLSVHELDSLITNYKRNNKAQALSFHEKYIPLLIAESKRLNQLRQIAECYNILGKTQRNNSMYDNALASHFKALEFSENNILQEIKSNNNIGVVYRRLGKPRLALQYHIQALKRSDEALLKKPDDKLLFEKCIALNSIGNINLTLNQPQQALLSFKESLTLEIKRSNTLGIAINYSNIGYAYQLLKQDEKALEYYLKSLKSNIEINSRLGRTICYNNIGAIYLNKNHFQEAKQMFDSAYHYSQRINDPYHASQIHGNLARVYLHFNKQNLAQCHLDTFYRQAVSIQSGSLCYEAHVLYSEYYEKQGQYNLALDYYKKAKNFGDSIINEKNAGYLNEIQTIYDSEKKEQAIELLTAENKVKQQRSLLLTITIGALIFALFIGIVDFMRRKKRNTQEQEALKQQLLRMQMNPHFLFNALGSIQNYMFKNETKKAARYLNNFASLTRSILEHTTQNFISLADEISALGNYLSLERMRTNNSFDYKLLYNHGIDTEFIKLPPMMVQPFVENAIKHGFKNLSYHGLLSIEFVEKNTVLHITIADNGHGIHKHKNVKKDMHHSMSMKIFEKRQKLLSKQLKKNIYFTVQNRNQQNNNLRGTVVKIQIPKPENIKI